MAHEEPGHPGGLSPPSRQEESGSRILGTSTTESTICSGSEVWRRGDNQHAVETICSTVRRRTRCCEPDTADSRSGRDPAAGTSSTSREKYLVPAAWGVGVFGIVAV